MRIPSDLQDADRQLAAYGRWAMDRFKKQHCASVEHKYRAPHWETPDSHEVLIADFVAIDVQRALNMVPVQYRRVLQAEYIPQRLPPPAIRRRLRLTCQTWDCSHLVGLRMFDNNWRLHVRKKCA